jgi:hypothetical protein
LTWIETIIFLYTSSPADAFVDTAAAAADAAFAAAAFAAAEAAATGDDVDNAVFDADGLLLNPLEPTSSLKTFEAVISLHWPVFAELRAITMIVRGLSNTKTTFIGLKPEIDSPEID